MAKISCGVDFGTTNSSVAITEDGRVRVLEVDPANDGATTSLPSLLYISREGERIVGRAAANAFIERNVDREVLLRQVELDVDIEGYVGAEPDKSEHYRPPEEGQNIREARRARATVEVNSPGRLFQSLKSSLRLRGIEGTQVFDTAYRFEELTAMILRHMRAKAETAAGEPVEQAVFGRPVRFSTVAGEDRLAEERLRRAAMIAGFKEVVFFHEPVAACVEYAIATDRRQRLMVVDIGGGTCDVCVMEFGSAEGAAGRLAESRILGVAGVPVAGDAIDKEIIRAKLNPLFGSRARYGPSNLPLPQFLFSAIADWQNLYKLNTEETINWLIAMEMSCDQPEAIRALRCLIQRNYGYPVRRAAERAKIDLSYYEDTFLEIHKEAIDVSVELQRNEFAHLIESELQKMLESIKDAESAAGVRPEDIDCVLTTGGTSLIPAIRNMLEERYGPGRLQQRDTFTSVATGLAIVARFL